jgi:hypothetical protein
MSGGEENFRAETRRRRGKKRQPKGDLERMNRIYRMLPLWILAIPSRNLRKETTFSMVAAQREEGGVV